MLFDKLLKQGHFAFAYFTELFNYDQFAENVPDAFLTAVLMVGPGWYFVVYVLENCEVNDKRLLNT